LDLQREHTQIYDMEMKQNEMEW